MTDGTTQTELQLPPFDPNLWAPHWRASPLLFDLHARLHAALAHLEPAAPPVDVGQALVEVARKRATVTERSLRETRILAQNAGANLLAEFQPDPTTADRVPLLAALQTVYALAPARPVLMHLKAKYAFPRPFELDPSIVPVVGNPGHPSYPSGHTCQHYLAAKLLQYVIEPVERDLAGQDPKRHAAVDAFIAGIFRVAEDVAVNREFAGVHYDFDTAAGRQVADKMFPIVTAVIPDLLKTASDLWRAWRRTNLLPGPPAPWAY
jgi:membrane-associated phospholipid phosphatase